MTGAASLAEVATDLWEAERLRSPVAPPTAAGPMQSLSDAYAVQFSNVSRRLAAGEHRIGHKIGLTSLAMQEQLGVDQPDFGVLTDGMAIDDGGRLRVSELISPRIEAEFAFLLDASVSADSGRTELVKAIGAVAVALEVIDSRIADWRIALLDTVADNTSSARIVLGPWAAATDETLARLAGTTIELRRGAAVIASGPGSAVLGDPVHALHWLAHALGPFGATLGPGDVVLAGAVHASLPLVAGRWTASAGGFALVALNVEE